MGTVYRCWELPKSVAYGQKQMESTRASNVRCHKFEGPIAPKTTQTDLFFGGDVILQGTLSLLAANYRHVGSAGEPHVHPLFVPCFDPCSYGDWSTFTANKNQSWEWVLRIAVEFWGQMQYPIFTHAHIIPYKHHLPAGTNIQHQQMTITLPIF